MMNKDINLLGHATQQETSLRKKIVVLRYASIALLFLVSTASVILFILISFSPLPALKEAEAQALSEIETHHPKIAQFLFLQERMSEIQNALKNRQTFTQAVNLVLSELPPGAVITSAKLSEKSLTVSVDASSLATLDLVSEALIRKTEEEGGKIQSLTLNELGLNGETGAFELFVEMKLL